jgi:hypothetical protein
MMQGTNQAGSDISSNSNREQQHPAHQDTLQYLSSLPATCTGVACSCCKIPEAENLIERQHWTLVDKGLHGNHWRLHCSKEATASAPSAG